MTPLTAYKAHWDQWHQQWHRSLFHEVQCDIGGWEVPRERGGNKHAIYEYFPEPYWGNSGAEKLKGLFLNINPGRGDDQQNIQRSTLSNLKDIYLGKGYTYSQTVDQLCADKKYLTTKWMYEKRVYWLQRLLEDPALDIYQTLLCDLIPWHTRSKTGIAKYIRNKKNAQRIVEEVIVPVAGIANGVAGALKDTVLVRSSLLLDLLNASEQLQQLIAFHKEYVVLDKRKTYSKLNSFLTVLRILNTDFLIFSGGASMLLPALHHRVVPVGSGAAAVELKEFILTKPFWPVA